MEMEACLVARATTVTLFKKANEVEKSTMDAKRVAAQLRLMAGQLDRLADRIIESSK